MKAYEISKNEADIPRGRVLMAIEGVELAVEAIVKAMASEGYLSTKCAEFGDKDGEIIEYFVIGRSSKADFMATYKNFK